MGTIIHLNVPQKAAPPVVTGAAPLLCEIVIFPGVRIERETTQFAAEVPGRQNDGGTGRGHRPRKSS